MRDYELTFIGKPDLDATNLSALVERVKGFVTADGGSVEKTEMWGMRHLTYPIRKYRDGHYVHMVIKAEGSTVARIEQRLRLVEDVIRYLLVVSEDEPVVAAAAETSGAAAAEAPETPASA